jgi:hypothetical protein
MPLGLTVPIKGDAKDLDKALKGASGGILGFGGDLGSTALKATAVGAAIGTAAIALSEMTNAAAADQAQQAKLAAAIDAATGSHVDNTAAVDAAIAAGQDLAFTDDQTRDALQSLVTSTGDLTAATGLLGTAQDVARFAGVDLATAADAVAKANEGQDTALTRMLPGLEKGATATDTLANAQRLAAGQAAVYGATTEASQAKASDAMSELGETIGTALLPALDAILPALTPMIKSFGTLVSAVLPLLIPILKLLGVVLGLVAKSITEVVGQLVSLINWLMSAVKAVGDLLNKIGPLRELGKVVGGIVGGLNASAVALTPTGRGATTTASSSGGGGSASVVFNITATGDSLATERAVARALRRVTRINAGVPGWATS